MQEQPMDRKADEIKVENAIKQLGNREIYKSREESLEYARGALQCLTEQLGRVQTESKRVKLEAGIRRWRQVIEKLDGYFYGRGVG